MSGGSFDYLCYKIDTEDLPINTVEEMAEWLRKKGKIGAAEKTERVLFHLRQAHALAKELKDIWFEAEWWRSGDHAEEQLDEAINEAGL